MGPPAAAIAAFLAALLHHGQYRGPADEVLTMGRATAGPGGGAGQFGPGGGLDSENAIEGYQRWEFWFEWNKDILLRSRDPRRAEMPALREGEAARVDTTFARDEILPLVLARCGPGDPHLVHAALLAAGKIGGPASVPPLLEALRHGSPETRRHALLALGLSGEREALLAVVGVYEDPSAAYELRAAAALGMGLQGRRESAPILRNYLQKNLDVEHAGGDARDLLVGSLVAAGMVGDPSFVPFLVGRYRDLLEERRSRCRTVLGALLTTLGRLRDAAALSTLLEAVEEKDIELRRSAALALGELGDPAAVPRLAAALSGDADLQVRGFAAISLGRIGGEEAVAALRSAFSAKGASRVARSYGALGLGLAWDQGSAADLRRALEAPGEEAVRGAYAIALGFLGDQESAETLFRVLENRGLDPDLRGYAAIAIGMIRPDEGLPRLLRVVREEADAVDDFRRGQLLGLGLFGESLGTPLVLQALSEERRDVVRGSAAMALGFLRDPAAARILSDLLSRGAPIPDRSVYACAALGSLGDAHTYPLLSEAFFNANYRVSLPLLGEIADLL
ncbi:MAG: HEAT repeat domain-containing protein [Planctomycetes bacterium]|nr:HEAT repeat domain-containing protein [Planctomycetota bacterium]